MIDEFKSVHATFLYQKLIHLDQLRDLPVGQNCSQGAAFDGSTTSAMDGELGRGSNATSGSVPRRRQLADTAGHNRRCPRVSSSEVSG